MPDELRRLAVDIASAGKDVERKVKPVLLKGALNIQRQLRKEMRGSRSFGALANSITFDIEGLAAEVGPVKGSGRGVLNFGANIAYFGTSRGGGTVPDPEGALVEEYPKFERFIREILGEL